MSFLDMVTDNVSKVTESALGDSSMIFGDLLNGASTGIIDSMKSLPGASELQSLGFPGIDDLFQTDNLAQSFDNYQQPSNENQCCGCESIFDQIANGDFMNDMFGNGQNPMDSIFGGQGGFEQMLKYAMALASGNPEELLKGLLGGGGDQGGGGGGGIFGDILGGIKGILGGGGSGGGLFGGILGGVLGGGGGGGLLGGILGGEGGLLGGVLGSITSQIPGMDTLLPIALKVAPLLL